MALDPSIALGVKLPQIEGPAQQYQNMMALQNAQRQSQVGELQYRNLLRDQQKQDQFSQDVRGADINSPEGMKQVQSAYLKMGNPKAAAELITADLERRVKLGTLDKQTLEADAIRAGHLSAGLAPLAAQIQQGRPVTHDQVFEIGNRLEASGLLPKGWQQSVPQNAMQLTSYVQNVVNQTKVGRDALEPFLPKPQAVGGDILNFAPQSPDFLKPMGAVSATAGEKSAAANRPFSADGAPNLAVQQYELSKAKTGAANTTVKLPEQEKAFETEIGKEQAKSITEGRKSAEDARDIINTVNEGKRLLQSGMITGFGAEFITSFGKALNQAGIGVGTDAIANTEAFAANMAQNVGKIIKQFGAGTGLSNADRDYAEKMAGGKITLNKESIEKILTLNDKAARNIVRSHNKKASGIKTKIPLTVEEPAQFSPKAVLDAADKIIRGE